MADGDATIARNRANGSSLGILRSSVNNQWTLGTISRLRREFAGDIMAEVGIDWRTASIDHYRDVRALLGGQYWVDETDDFTGPCNATYGDKINYFNTNDVDWIGGHVQAERATAAGSIYVMAELVRSSYHYTDHFARDPTTGGKLILESELPGQGRPGPHDVERPLVHLLHTRRRHLHPDPRRGPAAPGRVAPRRVPAARHAPARRFGLARELGVRERRERTRGGG